MGEKVKKGREGRDMMSMIRCDGGGREGMRERGTVIW